MMSIKKILLLAGMALATTAFAVPATASAVPHLEHEGAPIEEPMTETFTGNAGFETLGGGAECEVEGQVEINPGGETGTVRNFEASGPEEEACKGLGSITCPPSEVNDLGAGWPVHVTKIGPSTYHLTITSVKITITWFNTCPPHRVRLIFPAITLHLTTPSALSTGTIVGEEGEALFEEQEPGEGLGSEALGTLHAANPGTLNATG